MAAEKIVNPVPGQIIDDVGIMGKCDIGCRKRMAVFQCLFDCRLASAEIIQANDVIFRHVFLELNRTVGENLHLHVFKLFHKSLQPLGIFFEGSVVVVSEAQQGTIAIFNMLQIVKENRCIYGSFYVVPGQDNQVRVGSFDCFSDFVGGYFELVGMDIR
jgi:hypothetical protein